MGSVEIVGDLFGGSPSGLAGCNRTRGRVTDWIDVDFVSEGRAEVEALAEREWAFLREEALAA